MAIENKNHSHQLGKARGSQGTVAGNTCLITAHQRALENALAPCKSLMQSKGSYPMTGDNKTIKRNALEYRALYCIVYKRCNMRVHILRGNIPLERTKRTAIAIKKSRKSSKVVVFSAREIRAINRNLMKGN